MCWLTGGQATDEHTPPTKPRDRPWKRSLILIGNTSSNLHLSESALGLRMVAHNRQAIVGPELVRIETAP